MTEEQIERIVEQKFNTLDKRFLSTGMTQVEYNAACEVINNWAKNTKPKFTKQHYEFLADWLKNANMALFTNAQTTNMVLVRHSLADWLARDNPNFDHDKFLKAAS